MTNPSQIWKKHQFGTIFHYRILGGPNDTPRKEGVLEKTLLFKISSIRVRIVRRDVHNAKNTCCFPPRENSACVTILIHQNNKEFVLTPRGDDFVGLYFHEIGKVTRIEETEQLCNSLKFNVSWLLPPRFEMKPQANGTEPNRTSKVCDTEALSRNPMNVSTAMYEPCLHYSSTAKAQHLSLR